MTIFSQGQLGLGGTSQAFGANGQGPFPPLVASGGGGGLAYQYITASGATLVVGENSVETALGAFSGTLPSLASVAIGSVVTVNDASYNLAANNYTVNVNAADNASGIIIDNSGGVDNVVLNNSDQVTKFISLGVGNGWRMIFYGT